MRGAGLPFIDPGHHQYDTLSDPRLARLLGEIGESSEKHAGKAAPRRADQGHAGHPRRINVLSSKSAEAGQQTSRGAKCGTGDGAPPESAHLIVVISSNADRFIVVVVRSDHADLAAANPGSLKRGNGTCCLGMGIEQSADCLHSRPGPTLVSSVGPLLPGFELFRPDASSSRQSSPQREPAGYVPQPRLRSNPRAACLGPKSGLGVLRPCRAGTVAGSKRGFRCYRRPKKLKMAITITIAPTSQIMLFMIALLRLRAGRTPGRSPPRK